MTCGVPPRVSGSSRSASVSDGFYIRRRDEEPLALAHVRAVAPAQLILRTRPRHALPHQVGHECRLGRCDAGHTARRLRDRRDEPVTLVVTAQELALLAADAGEEEQVPLVWPDVDHLELGCPLAAAEANVEELA